MTSNGFLFAPPSRARSPPGGDLGAAMIIERPEVATAGSSSRGAPRRPLGRSQPGAWPGSPLGSGPVARSGSVHRVNREPSWRLKRSARPGPA
jgi:hypothetical protein